MVGQLTWLGCLVAPLATECTRQLDVPTMRAGAQLQRVPRLTMLENGGIKKG